MGEPAARRRRHRARRAAVPVPARCALACETWVGALAAAPIVLMYPLFLVIFGRSATTIVMIGFAAGLAPVILKTLEGLAGTRQVLINVGRSFKLTPRAAVPEDPAAGRAADDLRRPAARA